MKKATKSLTFSCQVYYPDEQSTSQLFTLAMERLAIRGYKVKVFCGFPDKSYQNTVSRLQVHNGVEVERLGFRLSSRKNYLNRALCYASYMICLFPKLLFAEAGTRFFAVTNPPFLAWVLALVSLIRRHRFTFMFLDLHPEGMIVLESLSGQVWYVRLWKYLNGLSYRRADKLLVLGRDMVPILSNGYGIKNEIFRYVPHWSALEFKKPMSFSASKFPQIWGVSDSFVVQYSGNMGLWHDIDAFVMAAKKLESHINIQFVFVGDGVRKKRAMSLAREIGVKNIHWKEFVPLSELSESLAACHLALISLNKNLEGVAVPCKLYGILASGRPAIAQVPEKSEVAMTVLENRCGLVVKPGDIEGLVDAIYKLSIDRTAVEQMSIAAFKAYTEFYQIENAVNILERELFY